MTLKAHWKPAFRKGCKVKEDASFRKNIKIRKRSYICILLSFACTVSEGGWMSYHQSLQDLAKKSIEVELSDWGNNGFHWIVRNGQKMASISIFLFCIPSQKFRFRSQLHCPYINYIDAHPNKIISSLEYCQKAQPRGSPTCSLLNVPTQLNLSTAITLSLLKFDFMEIFYHRFWFKMLTMQTSNCTFW